ncbi:coiled-coil domain-containing protein, partial [Geodermatophilus nigrescens]
MVGVLAGALLLGAPAPTTAAPPPPPNPSDAEIGAARSAQDAAAAEVGRIAALVATAEGELERATVQAEAAGAAYLAAEEALQAAQDIAAQTAAQLQAATEAIDAATSRLGTFVRRSYMTGSTLTTASALLDSAGPGELLQRAATLDYVGDLQVDVLAELRVARVRQANADSEARAARDAMAAAEAEAAATRAAADAQVAAQQTTYAQVSAEKAGYEQQLQAAQIRLLELQGARDAFRLWLLQTAAV